MTKTGFIDVHILHTVPFSNLNRDNLGSPKQMIFGGTARSRISSQCTKRSASAVARSQHRPRRSDANPAAAPTAPTTGSSPITELQHGRRGASRRRRQ